MRRFMHAAVFGSAIALVGSATYGTELAAPYVPTPEAIVDAMLTLAGVGREDYVVDLGSGDGRLVIDAVTRHGARGGFGVDIDAGLVQRANDNARKGGVADRARFVQQDLFATGVSDATVVTVYLLPSAMARLEKKLQAELRPGTRVVTHDYPFPTWPLARSVGLDSLDKIRINGQSYTQLWLYTVPARGTGSPAGSRRAP